MLKVDCEVVNRQDRRIVDLMADAKDAKKQPEKKAAEKKAKKVEPYKSGRSCPKCGSRLADHSDRSTCGKCGYTEWKKKG